MQRPNRDECPATLGARLRLSVDNQPQLSRVVREQIVKFTAALHIVEADLCDFLTAIGEALANAMEHAHSDRPIEISVWLVGEHQLIATVVDHGVGFDPPRTALVEPHLPDSFEERGRGLPIMRSCTDIFSVRSAPGCGTTVTLGRYLRNVSASQLSATG